MFCTKIGDKAFMLCTSLAKVTFQSVRRWDDPRVHAAITIGAYAFSSAGALTEVTLCEEVSAIGNYAFANCTKLAEVYVYGKPSVGTMPFRNAGRQVADGLKLHINPACAADADYMARLKEQCSNVIIVTDVVLSGVQQSSLSLSGTKKLTMKVMVRKESSWGDVDTSAIKVNYRATLTDPVTVLTPSVSGPDADGALTLELDLPEGASGFFQTTVD